MIIFWLVVAAILYMPFKKWVATSEAPFLSALLWPVMVVFFIVIVPLIGIYSKFKGK